MSADHRKKTLLVVSSYGRPCGIAQYVEHLLPVLEKTIDCSIEVAELPVSLLRTPDRRARKLSRQAMADIARRAARADWVNIQYEPGLFGITPWEIQRNLSLVVRNSRKCVVTHHTILYPENNPALLDLIRNPVLLLRIYRQSYLREKNLKLYRSRGNALRHVVHTKHARGFFRMLGLSEDRVLDHPLAFLSAQEKSELVASRDQDRASFFASLGIRPEPDTRLVGGFGFLSPYKGFETLINCLRLLPPNHHLVIAGGLHPEGIVKRSNTQPYLDSVLKMVDENLRPAEKKEKTKADPAALLERVHFVGSLENKEFSRVMNACDFVALPYSEEMQTSSGSAGLALDLGKRLFCSNNLCFKELKKYAGEALELFEISNHLELKTKILNSQARDSIQADASQRYRNAYTLENRARVYASLLGGME